MTKFLNKKIFFYFLITLLIFTLGVFLGITILGFIPNLDTAIERAAPWFPDEAVTIPLFSSSLVNWRIVLVAPRILNDPDFWKFSQLKNPLFHHL